MSRLEALVNDRAQEVVDALWPLLRAVVRAPGGRQLVTPVLVELARELQHHAESSEFATDGGESGTLVSVRGYQDAASAAVTVGCSPEYVRRLCRDGHVAFQRHGARGYLVDVDDLRRYRQRRAS